MPLAFVSENLARKIGTFWAMGMVEALRILCGVRFEIIGKKHLDNALAAVNLHQYRLVVVPNHQSAWETLFLTYYLNCPVFVLKKELTRIPIFGLYLYFTKMLIIDRAKKIGALKKIRNYIDKDRDSKRAMVIFPEGTRVKYGERHKFQSGIATIVKGSSKVILLPVAHNSGRFYGSFFYKRGTIRIMFLKPLLNSESTPNLTEYLETTIYDASGRL